MQLHLHGTLHFPEHLYISSHLNFAITVRTYLYFVTKKSKVWGNKETRPCH